MDIVSKLNIEAKIRKDCGVLHGCVEYVATTVLCWSKSKYEEQKEILQHFLILREKGQVPTYITSEDMKDWVISDGQNILRERFQTDSSEQRDRLIHLVWEVNMRLKLQDICRDVGMSPSSSEAPLMSAQDTQRAALADLESAALEKAAAAESYSRWYFDARFVARQALRELAQALAHPLARTPHTLSAVVGDAVTGLLGAAMEPANRRASSRAFSEVAVGVAVCVHDDLRTAGWAEERAFGAQCWRWARPSMVGVLHRDLLEQTGSPGALQAALRGNSAAVTSAIATAIAKALLAAADTALSAGPATPEEEEEENVPAAEDPVNTAVEPETPEAQDKTSVVDSEASTTSEEEMDSCVTSLADSDSPMTSVVEKEEMDSCMTSLADSDSPMISAVESEAMDSCVTSMEEIDSPMTSVVNSDAVMTSLEEVDSCMTSQEDMDSPLAPQMASEAPMTSVVNSDAVMTSLEEVDSCMTSQEDMDSPLAPQMASEVPLTSVVNSDAVMTSLEEVDSCMTSQEDMDSPLAPQMASEAPMTSVVNSDAVMTSLEEVDSCMTSQEDMDSPLTPQVESEAPVTSTVLTDVVMATLGGIPTTEEPLLEEGGKPDGFDMEIPVPLDTSVGDALLDLPHKEKKEKKGVRRFFGRVWKALKRSCCCCCVSTEID